MKRGSKGILFRIRKGSERVHDGNPGEELMPRGARPDASGGAVDASARRTAVQRRGDTREWRLQGVSAMSGAFRQLFCNRVAGDGGIPNFDGYVPVGL